ncbi:23546_t:CDS:1, partial [Racocetra persica]
FNKENMQDQISKNNESYEVKPEIESKNEPGIETKSKKSEPKKASNDCSLIEDLDKEVIDLSSLVTEFEEF